jgi:hypothetical protein
MPLFDPTVPRRLLWPKEAPWPRRRARGLVRRFEEAFPEISYHLEMGVLVANAQAARMGDVRTVRLYGGLVRHRKLRSAGLAVALAHETGHHLGGAPFHPTYRWLSSEERATEWALTEGLAKIFGGDHADVVAAQGTRNLEAIARSLGLSVVS